MNALKHFVVKVPKKYNDTMKLGDSEIYLDSKWNEFEHRVSYGEIVSAPSLVETGAEPGDTLIFHHHTTQNKSLQIDDETFVCMLDQENPRGSHAIAYRKKSGELVMLSGWVFVTPIEEKDEDTVNDSGIIVELGVNKVRKDIAEVYTPHKELERQGVVKGSVIGFSKNSDYKVKLDDGTIVYRMRVDDIDYVQV